MSDTYDMSLDQVVDSEPDPVLGFSDAHRQLRKRLARLRSEMNALEDQIDDANTIDEVVLLTAVVDRLIDGFGDF